ncbi:MAG: hypothetical protein K5891_08435 [Lachnospiraceae bacterium]|nr:hypothetical protein [Lachnospiraceae bacterium]
MKRFLLEILITTSVILILAGLFVYRTDPFYMFRGPSEGESVYLYSQVYQTPGAAEHFSYDYAIVGTSMTENMRASWFKNNMGPYALLGKQGATDHRTAKFSYAGAHLKDISYVLDRIFESENQVAMICIDLEDYQLVGDPEQTYTEWPDYIYEPVWWKETQYLWNEDVLWAGLGRTLETVTGRIPDPDDFYTWEDPSYFSEENAKRSYSENLAQMQRNMEIDGKTSFPAEDGISNCLDNIALIEDTIAAHPETKFYFFYPPYSILYWERQEECGRTDYIINVYKAAAEKLLQYSNVQFYSFQWDEEYITDLSQYRDEAHHTPIGNWYVFQTMFGTYSVPGRGLSSYWDPSMMEEQLYLDAQHGTWLFDADSVEEYYRDLSAHVKNYPYETLWE